MADPLTLSASIVTLLGALATVTQTCHNIWERYHSAHNHLLSLDVECSALSTSLQGIRQVIIAKDSEYQKMLKSDGDTSLFEDLRTTLHSCSIVIAHLNEQVAKLYHATDSKRWYTFSGRAKYVWNEDAIRSLLDRTRGLTGAINLILSTLQTQSLVNVYHAIQERQVVVQNVQQSAKALQLEDDATSTFFRPNGVEEAPQTAEEASHIDELMKSPAYKRAFLKWLKQPDDQEDDVIDSDTNIGTHSSADSFIGSSIASTSAETESPSAAGSTLAESEPATSPIQAATGPVGSTEETHSHARIAEVLQAASDNPASDGDSATLVEPEIDSDQPPAYSDVPPAPSQQALPHTTTVTSPPRHQVDDSTPRAAPPPLSQAPAQTTPQAPVQPPPAQVQTSTNTTAPDPPISTPSANPAAPPPKSKPWWSFSRNKSSTSAQTAETKAAAAAATDAEKEKEAAAAQEEKEARIAKLQKRLEETRADLAVLREVQGLVHDGIAATRSAKGIRKCKRRIKAYETELRSLGVEVTHESPDRSDRSDREDDAETDGGTASATAASLVERIRRDRGQGLARLANQQVYAQLEAATAPGKGTRPSASRSQSQSQSKDGSEEGKDAGETSTDPKKTRKSIRRDLKAQRQARRELVRGVLEKH